MGQPVVPGLAEFAEDDLAAIRLVAAVEVVATLAPLCGLHDGVARASRIDAANHEIGMQVDLRIDASRLGNPVRAHQQVQPVHEQRRLVLADVVRIEPLPADVELAYRVIVVDRALDTTGVTKLHHRVMQARERRQQCAAGPARSDHDDFPGAPRHVLGGSMQNRGAHTTSPASADSQCAGAPA